MNKAFFLDRDGIVNKERGVYTFKDSDFEFVPGLFQGLKLLQDKGYLLIVVSNQSGIAKRIYSHDNVLRLHKLFLKECIVQGVLITDFYYCPHHPDEGNCLCRKPNSLLLEKALSCYDIDPSISYFIGDRQRDADAAIAVGVTPVLVESNASLAEAIKHFEW